MNHDQNKMKAKLIEVANVIAKREEALSQKPMENVQETMFVNSMFAQQTVSLQILAISNETILPSIAVLVLEINLEPTFPFDCQRNEPIISNTQLGVQYKRMPPQPPLTFLTRNNNLYKDNFPFGIIFQIKPKEPTTLSSKMEKDVVS